MGRIMGRIDIIEEKDVDEVRELLRITWLDAYGNIMPERVIKKVISVWHSGESILQGIDNPKVYFAGYRENHKILGIVTAGKIGEEIVQIYRLYVLPTHQRKGIGSKLLSAAMDAHSEIKKFVADVEEKNYNAILFYKKKGFKEVEKRTDDVAGEKISTVVMELLRD